MFLCFLCFIEHELANVILSYMKFEQIFFLKEVVSFMKTVIKRYMFYKFLLVIWWCYKFFVWKLSTIYFISTHHLYFVLKFIRKVSDSEQTKRAVPRKTRTALNVILSNCTKLRTYFLIICIQLELEKETILQIDRKLWCDYPIWKYIIKRVRWQAAA